MKKFSSFEQVVGNIPESEKGNLLYQKEERFSNQIFNELQEKECEKTQEEMSILSLVNEITNRLRKKYGLTEFNIPAKNIHIIKKEEWPKRGRSASCNFMMQAIAIEKQDTKIAFMEKILHEMIHFKSYSSMQITTNEEPREDSYRAGLTITKRDGSRLYFRNINEAVTEELTKQLFLELSSHPIFSKEMNQTSKIAEKIESDFSVERKKYFGRDTYYAEAKEIENDKMRFKIENFSYSQERRILKKLICKILKRNSDKLENEQSVFDLFASSMMTGNILNLGRLIDTTFPKGTFRKIGELDNKIDEQETFIDSL